MATYSHDATRDRWVRSEPVAAASGWHVVIVGTAYAVVECRGTLTPIDRTVTAMTKQRTWRCGTDAYPAPTVRPATAREVASWQLLMAQTDALRKARTKQAKRDVFQGELFAATREEVAA